MKKYFLILFLVVAVFSPISAEENSDFRLSNAIVTPKALKFIRENYIDQERLNPREMLKSALNQLQKGAAEILVTFEQNDRFTITIDQAVKKFAPKELNNFADLWGVLKEIYTFIEIHYHGTIKQQDIEYIALDGMLTALDPHSNILTPKLFNEFRIGTKGKFGGIGIVIGSRDGDLTVISPIEGTPAWKAGIKSGDKIIQIGEESTVNMSLTEAVELLRGDVGTAVTVVIDRAGRSAPFNVVLKRAIINIQSIQSASIPAGGKNIGYIKIKNFQENTDKDFEKHLAKLRGSANFGGLILDLRNNPGGLLNQAIGMVDKFISNGVIVSTIGAGRKSLDQETASGGAKEPPYPLVVIVNEGSASASEIVAGTLQSYGRAIVLGNQTFGKGSVQTVFDLHDGAGLKLTIAEYLNAGRNAIQSVGVTPDIKLIPETVDKEKMNLFEDEHESEKSLEKHLSQHMSAANSVPTYKVGYFQPAEKDEEELSRREYSDKPDFSKDIAAQIASRIIANSNADTFQNVLAGAKGVIETIEKEEDSKLAAALKNLDVDWSPCQTRGKPVLQVSFALEKNGEAVKKAVAGNEINLSLTAKNIGDGDFCRLAGVSSSEEHILKNKEFVFGKIPPSGVKKWSVPLKVPPGLVSENLPFTVKFYETGPNQPAEFKAIVPVEGGNLPRYAYNFRIGVPSNVKVQKNSMPLEKVIPLNFEIKNTGGGSSPNAVAIIKNSEENRGVFIDVGRAKVGKIDAGQTKQATFKFHLEEPLPKSAFELEFAILDHDTMTSLTKKIEFNAANGTAVPAAGQWNEPPRISVGKQSFPIVTDSSKYLIAGRITDEQQVKDYYIFVGDDKVAYSSNPAQTGNYDISAELPLKDGNNLVTIVARDNQDMSSRFSFVIEKRL